MILKKITAMHVRIIPFSQLISGGRPFSGNFELGTSIAEAELGF